MIAARHLMTACALLALVATPVRAQEADESALDQFEQTRPVPTNDSPASVELRDAVRRMAQRPTDPIALSDAGYASIKLGDAAAALNFFTRANAVQPNNARTLAGLGSALVRTENPFEALKYFDDALRLGASERLIAFDRALAFDLLGNFARAHQDYQLARSLGDNDELIRRYAMSLSMAGKAKEADAMLVPLLQRNDPDAWRARAFMLAARGEQKEAGQIAQGFLSADAARRMEGFLRQMPRMTEAQRAAAMHFGHFPVGRIGEDTPDVRKLASATGAVRTAASAVGQDRLVPSGEPLGTASRKSPATKRVEGSNQRNAVAAVEPKNDATPGFSTENARQKVEDAAKGKPVVLAAATLPPPDAARPPVRVTLPPAIATMPPAPAASAAAIAARADQLSAVDRGVSPAQSGVVQAPSSVAAAPAKAIEPTIVTAPVPAQATAAPLRPSISETEVKVAVAPRAVEIPVSSPASVAIAAPPSSSAPAALPALPVTSSAVASASRSSFDLGALVQSIEIPESEQRREVAPVDLRALERRQASTALATAKDPKTGKPKVESKTPPQPARIWVQIATGAEAALPTDFRRMSRKSPALFKGQSGWTSDWGRTSRLLVGPFPDSKAAKKWEADFKKEFGDAFVWQSANGTVVDKLAAK